MSSSVRESNSNAAEEQRKRINPTKGKLRVLTSDYGPPQGACSSFKTLYSALEEFEKDLHQHIHLENNILFPRAIQMEAEVLERLDQEKVS